MLVVLVASLLAVASAVSIVSFRAGEAAPPPDGTAREGVDLGQRIADFTTATVAESDYLPPLPEQRRTLARGVGLLIDGRHSEAARKLAEADFRIRTLTDTTTGRRFAEVSDRVGEQRRGWGRVYVALGDPATWSVQVPHPVADAYSDTLGVGVLRGTPGGVLVLAGAHRKAGAGDAADVAHRRDSVFHAICAELTARHLPGVQVHGYADRSAPDHDVIVSTGAGDDARTEARGLARSLDGAGFRVCRAWKRKCPLAGRTNIQGRLAADRGVPFLHVEVGREAREDLELRGRVIAAMAATVARWS